MNDGATEQNLPVWLEPAQVQLDNERVPMYLAAVHAIAGDARGRELDLVRGAHGELTDEMRAWLTQRIQQQDKAFTGLQVDALLGRLAGAAVLHRMDTSLGRDAAAMCLAIASASFLGKHALIEQTASKASRRLDAIARELRERADVAGTAAQAAGELPVRPEPDAESGVVPQSPDRDSDVWTVSEAIGSLAAWLDGVVATYAKRQAALDEEVDVLWWALRGEDQTGRPWASLEPAECAVRAASELVKRIGVVPGPPDAGVLLARLLIGQGEVTIGEVAQVAAGADVLPSSNDSLLPVLAIVGAIREVSANDEVWPGLAETKFGLSVALKVSARHAAEQLYRELQLHQLVT